MNDASHESRTPKAPRLLDRVRAAIRRRHYSDRTEETYVYWIRRFIYFSGKRHPAQMGEAEVTAFLNHLARERDVAASTQNQALAAAGAGADGAVARGGDPPPCRDAR